LPQIGMVRVYDPMHSPQTRICAAKRTLKIPSNRGVRKFGGVNPLGAGLAMAVFS
jgi:hypothetical protein